MTTIPTPGEAAALPTVEAIMELACEFASAHYFFERFGGQGHGDVRDAAREALRSALARALPVGEERDGAPGTALVSRVETLSEPGAALKVQVLHLTEAGRECLTLNAAASNHLHRLLGWADCEVGHAPDEMVQGVRELAARGLETDEAGKARLLQAHQTASNVPKYIRAAIKSLRGSHGTQGRNAVSVFGREHFEARMRGLNCAVNLHRYKTGRDEYKSKTIEAACGTWVEAWSRASYEGRKLSVEGRRIAYAEGLKKGAATLSPDRPAEGTKP